MANVQLNIDKTRYMLSCADGQEENLLKLAKILSSKVVQVKSTGYMSENLALVMAGLLLANETEELRKKAEKTTVVEKIVEKEVAIAPAVSEKAVQTATADMEKIIQRISVLAQRMESA